MIDFHYMIELKAVSEDQIPKKYVNAFDNLKSDVNNVLGALSCPTHGQKPRVILNCDDGEVRVTGLGPCCEKFGATMREAIDQSKLHKSDEIWRTEKKTYTYPPHG